MPDRGSRTVSVAAEFLDARERIDAGLPIAMIAFDMAGIVTHWSTAAETLYGWRREEALGQRIGGLTVGPESEDMARSIMEQVLAGRHWEGEFRAWHKSGRAVDVHVLDVPILNQDGEMVGICGLSMDVSAQRTEWREAVQRSEQLVEMLEFTRDSERTRIARDIHDDIGQYLTSLRTDLLSLREIDDSCVSVSDSIDSMVARVDSVLSLVRRICAELRPPILEQFGLAEAVESLAEQVATRHGLRCAIDTRSFDGRLQPEVELAVFRIAEEALTNVERHADASSMEVRLACESSDEARVRLCLEIIDDGSGVDSDSGNSKQSTTSLGIAGMRARARRLQGDLAIGHGPGGRGTAVRLSIDVQPRRFQRS